MQKVCLVLGAGAGIGGTVAARFAMDGYHSVLCRRSDEEGLKRLVDQIHEAGGSATGRLLNAVDEDAIENCIEEVERDIGPIEVVLFNLGAEAAGKLFGDIQLLDEAFGHGVEFDDRCRHAAVPVPW